MYFFYFSVHDRKVYVFGICSMLSLPHENRPEAVKVFAPQFLPALLVVFKGLVSSYESKSLFLLFSIISIFKKIVFA